MTAAEKKWNEIKGILEADLEFVSYSTWFSDLSFHNYDKKNGVLYLVTTDEIKKDILSRRYPAKVVELSKDFFDDITDVKFLLPGDTTKSKPANDADYPFGSGIQTDPRFSFDTFVVGDNNRFAYNCALMVAESVENPSRNSNPLFLYGNSGLGKTHLLQAIYQYVCKHFPQMNVLFITAEEFMQDYTNASRAPGGRNVEMMNLFKAKYRNLDMLIIDDIQYIQKGERSREEIFWTYNSLYTSGKQLVFSSDLPPKDLLDLEERLRSRLAEGLIVDLQPPAFEVKVAILKNWAVLDNIPLDDGLIEVIELIADKIKTNIREMESAFNSVVAHSKFQDVPINKTLARSILHGIISDQDAMPTPAKIKKTVAAHYGIKVADIESSKKPRNISFPRQLSMFLCRDMTDLSFTNIGDAFGGRHHTTVMHACDEIETTLKDDANLREIVSLLKTQILSA